MRIFLGWGFGAGARHHSAHGVDVFDEIGIGENFGERAPGPGRIKKHGFDGVLMGGDVIEQSADRGFEGFRRRLQVHRLTPKYTVRRPGQVAI